MASIEVSGMDAWLSLARSEHTRWPHNISRLRETLAVVAHEPKFSISAEDTFFCIGSCFARNIEEHLIYSGQRVLSKKIVCPVEEWPNRVNGFVNKFTTHSMLNEIDWVCERPSIDEALFEETPHGWLDLQLCPRVRAVSLERAIERRTYLVEDYFKRLGGATVVVLTLGLNEVWRDARTGRYLNAAPSLASTRREPARYTLEITDVVSNANALEQFRDRLMQLNPAARIVITVSPVPMSETFSGKDVAAANTYSKAVLRVSAEEFARAHSNVDYFPTFDMISLSPRELAYGADCLHVSNRVVQKIIEHFLALYSSNEISAIPFNELAYLAVNPDVEAAVRRGELESGFQHWVSHGRAEHRALAPEEGPTSLMITAGAV